MTAEIAIMNKEAIALAADSAVTINTGSGRKIYNTVNKLFALTKYAPIGIMVYGRADFMGVPWESIIKTYRPAIGSRTFGTVQEYVKHFVGFLSKRTKSVFPEQTQVRYFREMTASAFLRIRNQAQGTIKQIIADKGKATRRDIQSAVEAAIDDNLKFIAGKKLLAGLTKEHARKIKRRYAHVSGPVRSSVFQKIPLSKRAIAKLALIPSEICCRQVFNSSDSGVIIAGFGNDQIFPFLSHMIFGGVAGDFVRHEVVREVAIQHDDGAVIKPFAQSEMVEAFMEGIDPNCNDVVKSYWRTIMDQLPRDVANAIPSLSAADRTSLTEKLRKVGRGILKDFDQKLVDYQKEWHIHPVIDAVAVLPKDLLAEVAESLVNLTSFKRRISMTSAETVGGPIDVAVISRGDGFVWIKRKHYFRPELNPQFMSQYSGGLYGSRPKQEL